MKKKKYVFNWKVNLENCHIKPLSFSLDIPPKNHKNSLPDPPNSARGNEGRSNLFFDPPKTSRSTISRSNSFFDSPKTPRSESRSNNFFSESTKSSKSGDFKMKFELVENQMINEYPYMKTVSRILSTNEKYDLNSWEKLISSSHQSGVPSSSVILENFASHYENKLLSLNEWELFKSIAKAKQSFSKNQLIFQSSSLNGSKDIYFVDVGAVSVKKRFCKKKKKKISTFFF